MRIEVKAVVVCGQVRFYPVNQSAYHLSKLTKSTTFTINMLRHAKAMGASLFLTNETEASRFMHDLTLFGRD